MIHEWEPEMLVEIRERYNVNLPRVNSQGEVNIAGKRGCERRKIRGSSLATSPPNGGISQNASSNAPAIPFWGFYRSWHHASLKVKNDSRKKGKLWTGQKWIKSFSTRSTLRVDGSDYGID